MLLLAQRDIQDTQSAAIRRRARQKLPGTVAQKRGLVRVHEVRRNHISRTQQEIMRLETREKREEAAREKKILLHGKTIAKRFGLVGKNAIS
jgi:hypothetical protein